VPTLHGESVVLRLLDKNQGRIGLQELGMSDNTLARFKSAIAKSLREQVWPWLESGKVKPVIYKVFPAAQAAEAHALMESNQHIGKLVLSWV